MREIKFRGINTAFRDVLEIDRVCDIDWIHGEVYFENGTDVATSLEDAKLMQFTGWNDKNGVEIFEGDIVKNTYQSDITPFIEEVTYEDYGFTPMQIPCDYDEVYLSESHLEVIGNIHQNPELLVRSN
jgi:uncharacterized phage protein (TIGR01671 family)